MGNYFGTYKRTLDEKHRLQIPPKFVKGTPGRFISTKGHDGSLAIFDENEFNDFLEGLKKFSYLDREARAYIRIVTSSINVLELDSHGRISIPANIASAYGLENETMIIGCLDHFELFNLENYKKAILENEDKYDDLAQEISDKLGNGTL